MAFYNDGNYSNKTLDGTCQHLTMYTNKAFREYVPFHDYDVTYLKITNDHHDVNMINKNFLNITAQMKITPKSKTVFETRYYKFGKTIDDILDDEKYNEEHVLDLNMGTNGIVKSIRGSKIYIGWKNSSEIIQEMTVYNNNRETGFQQIHADRENYLESMKFKTKSEKDIYRNCHFTYENYFKGYEGEVPGIIKNVSEISPWVITSSNLASIYGMPGTRIYARTQAFADIYGLTLKVWTKVNKATMQEIIDKQTGGNASYVEWKDFCYDYSYNVIDDEDDSKDGYYQDDCSPANTYKDIDALADALIKDSTKHPLVWDSDKYKLEFVHERELVWNTDSVYTAEIPLIIPLKDLPAFNSMDVFEKPFGDITLKLMFGYRSLMIFAGTDKCKQYGDSDYDINDFMITNLTCECWGYNVGNDVETLEGIWGALRSRYGNNEHGRIYEARFTDFKNFDGNLNTGRFNIEFPYGLEMVKYIHMTFPTKNNHTTVFRNPMLKDVKLKLDGVLYPREENIRTDNRLFYHLQINDYEFDEDVKYSYTCPVLNTKKTALLDDAEKKEELDDSNFIITWPLSVGPFMAVHRYSDNVNINFTAEIIAFINYTYGVQNSTGKYDNNVPSPQIWFTHDSCWILNLQEGLQFMRNVCPSSDLYQGNGDDVFYMHA